MIWLVVFFLTLSIALNILFVWYIKYAVKKLLFVSNNIGDFLDRVKEYREHLEIINGMETYYGDEIIENFIKHTNSLIKDISAYEQIYSLTHTDGNEDIEKQEEV